ncbi:hypothetical protein SDRG_13407 [Saprolegnia diclina VS20]|uniref:PH domain-containing protein n=1 Tax=Saprolegnia diclina (strain VS20) TaxID=1156394 RepID=T0RGN3_SAPDV|nr:hypothetical protein SDRG_13407 [Saprolegnia diclina VS20]EQC28897.1 hypothetical protein SDRG_13407 [Saprolegnia diclina VS20]|eukprot:XP_008617714.1 hypothetical protein SDRG_13407 [Saprolegnia diclina VS20]
MMEPPCKSGWVQLQAATATDVSVLGRKRRWVTLGVVRGHPILYVSKAPTSAPVGGLRLEVVTHLSVARDVCQIVLASPGAEPVTVSLSTPAAAEWLDALLYVQSSSNATLQSDASYMAEEARRLQQQLIAAVADLDRDATKWDKSTVHAGATIDVSFHLPPHKSVAARIQMGVDLAPDAAYAVLSNALDLYGPLGYVFGHSACTLHESRTDSILDAAYRIRGTKPRRAVLLQAKCAPVMAVASLNWEEGLLWAHDATAALDTSSVRLVMYPSGLVVRPGATPESAIATLFIHVDVGGLAQSVLRTVAWTTPSTMLCLLVDDLCAVLRA